MNGMGAIGIMICIVVLIIILGIGFFSLNSTIKEELGVLRKEMRVETVVNGYVMLLAINRIVNERKDYTFEEYLKEINEIRYKTRDIAKNW